MRQIEKQFLAEECGVDESQVHNSYPIRVSESIDFAPHHHQKILDRTKIRTARKRNKSGEFTINGERFRAEFEIAMTMNAFVSLFDNGSYTPEQFGFNSELEMWVYYCDYLDDDGLVFVHQIIDLEKNS